MFLTTAARRTLAAALAAAALTTGVGLAGSGIAEASPNHLYTCINNVRGTVTVEDHGQVNVQRLYLRTRDAHCATVNGQNSGRFEVGRSFAVDPNHKGWSTEGNAFGYVEQFDPASGAVKVTLQGQIRNGPENPRQITAQRSVSLQLNPGNGYEMDETTVDSTGRKVNTRMFFDLQSPTA